MLSVVIPVYNEAEVLPLLVKRLRPVLDGLGQRYEVVAVDDGSKDLTPALLQAESRVWPQLRILRLRANAGHQAAISAGLVAARGDDVVTLDADLQDPPELIPDMLHRARTEGVDVVYAVRTDRSSDGAFKRVSARWSYALIRRLSGTSALDNAGDFRLMSRPTVEAINTMPEQSRVLRFLVPALGFPSSEIGYRRERRPAGRSKYPFLTMVRLFLDSVTGFSTAPLRAATLAGLFAAALAVALIAYALIVWIAGSTVPGWASIVSILTTFSAVQLLSLGLLGEYVGRIYTNLQGRPSYYVAYDSLIESDEPPLDSPPNDQPESGPRQQRL